MAKQIINVGSEDQSGDGESIRSAFIKINENFDEVYSSVDIVTNRINNLDVSELSDNTGLLGGGGSANESWTDSQNRTFNVVTWSSGKTINIQATPYETVSLITSDSRTDSDDIFFVWDQDFIDNVWNGYDTVSGEGQGYEVSLDGGVTWYAVERNGYWTNNYFYFAVPWEVRGTYTFTYSLGQTILMRFNRGSLAEVWFDLADAPDVSRNVIGVDMSVVVEAVIQSPTTQTAKIIRPDYSFMNVLYDDNSGQGGVESGSALWVGSGVVADLVAISIRRSLEPEDSGRIYARFDNGAVGTMTFYWNAKLYTIS